MIVQSPKQQFILLLLLSFSFIGYGQSYDLTKIGEEVTYHNNNKEFDKSILLLEQVISYKNATPYERYQAYFLKYQTYKRLFVYDKAAYNLHLALEEGLKSDQKERVEAQVKFEELFLAFDLLNFEKVEELLLTIDAADFNYISFNTQGFYYGVLGTMEIKRKKYTLAEEYYDKAIEIFTEHDPRNLPMIYRKQIDLYRLLNQYDKSIASFELGLKYAKQHNIDVYILNMYFDLVHFYKSIGDVEKAVQTQEICNRLAKEYDEGSVLGRLNVLESQLDQERIDAEKKRDRAIILTLIGSLLLILLLLLLLYKYLNQIRKNKKQLEEENDQLRNDILHMISKSEADMSKILRLTDRQSAIIELVKQGKTNKEIGYTLFVSENTVKYHLKNIYDVLRVSRRVEL